MWKAPWRAGYGLEMATLVLHGNINHCRESQDLFLHQLAAMDGGFGVVMEPYSINHPNWAMDLDESVALIWQNTSLSPLYTVIHRGRGHVAVTWGSINLVRVYIPPRRGAKIYEEYLDALGDLIQRRSPRPVLVTGDFNAHSWAWGCPGENMYGRVLGQWAAALGLVLVNTGSRSTCVRPQRSSIVDITWCSPNAARQVINWEVDANTESLSDHRFIQIGVRATPGEVLSRRAREKSPRRWVLRKLDVDALIATVLTKSLCSPREGESIRDNVEWIRAALTEASDASIPRF
jgi:hypothetical protein